MYEKKIPLNLGCGYSITMQIIGGKWKICIIDALRDGSLRPNELFKEVPDAPKRVINQQIRELLSHQVIDRKIFAEQPPRSEYFLTDLGKSLLSVIDFMDDWGEKNRQICEQLLKEK